MDEEQIQQRDKTLNLLFDAGYFRANMQGLSDFDKIVGGMVWCISLCAHKVDVDLLYSDNQTIGQKIALTERIVKVLPELSCPFSLEPHQIQGLDYEHIFPCVQWLVKEAGFVRERLGDETLNFTVYQFGQQGWKLDSDLDRTDGLGVLPMVRRHTRKVYRRVMRMERPQPQMVEKDDQIEDELRGEENAKEQNNLLVVTNEGKDNILMYVEVEDESETDGSRAAEPGHVIYSKPRLGQLEEEMRELNDDECQLEEEYLIELGRSKQLMAELDQLDSRESENGNVTEDLIHHLYVLLAKRDELKAAENSFKAECKQEIANLDAQIEFLEAKNANGNDIYSIEKSQQNIEESMERAKSLTAELAKLNREIARLGRRTGAKPSQAELSQYQRKFVELCNQTNCKHKEAKRQFTTYNTLVNVRDFIEREMKLLNNMDDQRELAQREEYRESLLENLQQISRGVDTSLDKLLCKKRALRDQRDQLCNRLQMLSDKQRLYTKTVVEFQQECQRNERLREEADKAD